MDKLSFLFSPDSHILFKDVDISSFHLLIFICCWWRRMSTFGGVLCLKLFDSVLSLHGNFTDFFELLSIKLYFFFILFESVSVFMKLFFVSLNLFGKMEMHFLGLIFRNTILMRSGGLSFLFFKKIVLMLKFFDVGLKLSSHGRCLLVVGYELIILLVIVGVFLIDSFILGSDFLVLLAKDIVFILKLMELHLHLVLFLKTHSFWFSRGNTFLLFTVLSLEISIVLRKGFILFKQLMVTIFPNLLFFGWRFFSIILKLVMLCQLLIFMDCIDKFFLNLLDFL